MKVGLEFAIGAHLHKAPRLSTSTSCNKYWQAIPLAESQRTGHTDIEGQGAQDVSFQGQDFVP